MSPAQEPARSPRSDGQPATPDSGSPPDRETTLRGVVDLVTFHAEDSGYTVLRLLPDRGWGDPEDPLPGRVAAVGDLTAPAEGLRLELQGEWTSHPRHGRQFRFQSARLVAPTSAAGLVRYLASKAFHGIGETLARRIVEALGSEALDVIQSAPERLEGVKGLAPKVREELVATVTAHVAGHRLRAFLTGLGLNRRQLEEVARRWGPDCEASLRANPYQLARGIAGVAFRTADRAARQLGIAPDAPERIEAGIVHLVREATGEGHSCLEEARLLAAARELLGPAATEGASRDALARLVATGDLILDEELRPEEALAYLPGLFGAERQLARNLAAKLAVRDASPLAQADELDALSRATDLELHPAQREAVLGLLGTPVGLLTGGPGVGKTTVLRLVVQLAEARKARVLLCSPTGRAAKRMAEATGHAAATVHRTLGYDPVEQGFSHGPDKLLEADLVVVDEVSMLDLGLAHSLVRAIGRGTRLLFVGDPDQLPSVGAGNVLADLLDSGCVPTWRLTRVFRQDAASRIVTNAHHILAGQGPELPARGDTTSDFYFFPAEDDAATAERLVEVVTERIPRTFDLDWLEDVQVLAPMYAGESGVDALNERLRATLPRRGPELEHRGVTWRVGDRVIHTKNDYEREVFNGDMGRVRTVHRDGSGVVVRYPEQELFYSLEQLSDLRPAFAITVHRAQGSEYPAVVIPLVTRHYLMLQRHLLYTAVTRAKRLVVLVGQPQALELALANAAQAERQSGLAERLREAVGHDAGRDRA